MFYFPITHQEIAEQIAGLLNTYSNLQLRRNSHSILNSKTKYVVETHGKFVIGVAGVEKVSYQLSELKHMVVHPDWRGKGLGGFVAKRALNICQTPSVFATVRTSNAASVRALEKIGFLKSHEFFSDGNELSMLVRAASCQTKKPSKSNSFDEMNWINPIQGFTE